jgi:hypothetical protein
MASFLIGMFDFEFWDGPAPAIPTRRIVVTHQPGVSGVSHQALGVWADSFSTVLTSHHATSDLAAARYWLLTDLIGAGPQQVAYNDMNWSGVYGVGYNVESIELIDIRSAIILIGPGYSYPGGASLVTRFTITPQAY